MSIIFTFNFANTIDETLLKIVWINFRDYHANRPGGSGNNRRLMTLPSVLTALKIIIQVIFNLCDYFSSFDYCFIIENI